MNVRFQKDGSTPALPPGPKMNSLRQLYHWIRRPYPFLEEMKAQCGDPFRLNFKVMPLSRETWTMVHFSDPAAVKELFTNHDAPLSAAGGNAILKPFLGQHSLLLLDGATHLRHRRLLLPPFHGERMRAYGEQMRQVTQKIIRSWPIQQEISALPAMQDLSSEVIIRTVFGVDDASRLPSFKEEILKGVERITGPMVFFPFLQRDLGPWSPWRRFRQQAEKVRAMVFQEIDTRREQLDEDREDILSLLLAARDEQGQPLTPDELYDELQTLLVAGHETTATALSWALYWIHATPGVRDRLLDEIRELGPEPEADALSKLTYLDAVCKETLRLYPVIPIVVRETTEPFAFQGWQFDRGTYLVPSIYLVHHREDLYPEPKKFRPERFLERKFTPYEYLPFGGGTRRCIGMAFALYEMKIALGTILSELRIELPPGPPPKPVRRNISLVPERGTRIIVQERLS